MLTALQLSVLTQTLSMKSPSKDHNNTEQHRRKNAVTRKRWWIWKR